MVGGLDFYFKCMHRASANELSSSLFPLSPFRGSYFELSDTNSTLIIEPLSLFLIHSSNSNYWLADCVFSLFLSLLHVLFYHATPLSSLTNYLLSFFFVVRACLASLCTVRTEN